MNDNITKTHFFQKINYDLKGHIRSHEVILKFQNHLFRYILFVQRLIFWILFKNVNIMRLRTQIFHKMKYDLKGYPRSYNPNLSSAFVNGPILIKICMFAYEMSLLWYEEVLWCFYFKTFWPNYNLDVRFYGQLLSLFLNKVKCLHNAPWK